ncbi:hypothetical protein B0T16DRAFT_386763 [Cercophora newfieldiana]|uniref:Chromo domain-containing protein n=1 Tax=Cercophora newfieldiana TaxID=92897 RepID=A0AA39YES8_9PEZI|nr:hypothetical protein B0T16DRAFT_386763 [Cercophora newfieldiana]
MFQSLTRKFSSENPPGTTPEGDDDDISVTSTVEAEVDEDQEFEVEDILAEHKGKDGKMTYLVKWANFELHDATLEPPSHLSDQLMSMWAEKKQKIKAGEAEAVQLEDWQAAKDLERQRKAERQRRREEKRKRLGLSQTPPPSASVPGSARPVSDPNSSESEAAEDEFIAEDVSDTTAKVRPQQKQTPASVSKPTASSTKAGSVSSQATVPKPQPQPQPRRTSLAKPATAADANPSSGRPAVSASSSRVPNERPSVTGYQGTARKLSDKPSSSNARGVTSPKIIRPVANPAKSKMMAKKTVKAPAGNIFTSGRVRKKRGSLRDIQVDPTKASTSRQTDKWSIRRKLEMASRAKEDLPPDADALYLFDPSMAGKRTSSLNSTTKETSQVSPTTILSPELQVGSPTELQPGPEPKQVPEPRPSALKAQSSIGSLSKPRKVRFADEKELSSGEPMDIDAPGPREGRTRLRSPTLEDRPTFRSPSPIQSPPHSQITMSGPGATQSIEKLLALGNRKPLNVAFNGMPAESRFDWVRQFMGDKTLTFRLSCLAQTVEARRGDLFQNTTLAAGTITSKTNEKDLDHIAEFLKSSLLGLFYPHSQFNILVYPAKCEDWKIDIPSQIAENSPSVLQYCIFSSPWDYNTEVGSLHLTPPAVPSSKEEKEASLSSRSAADVAKEVAFKRFFNFDYKALFPRRRKQPATDVFFLVFPESKAMAMLSLFNWLRACNPHCQVFFSCQPGSWNAFRAAVDREPGVVIIHDILTPTFRRFPNLSRYLVEKIDEYWCFAEPNRPQPFPSMSLDDVPSPLINIQLTRMFSLRTAILLTPSFMVSQPQQLEKFLQWFMAKDRGGFNYRLVTAWNIHDYLRELNEEKSLARMQLLYNSDTTTGVIAELRGLSAADCDARSAASLLALELHRQRLEKAGLYESEEENSRLIYADRCIDPNDEQSLVNWFGWWSTMRTDEFRKFYVVGSGEILKNQPRRGERSIRIPRYSSRTINDPDTVLQTFQQSLQQESDGKPEVQPPSGPDTQLQVSSNGGNGGNGGGCHYANQPLAQPFLSELVESNDFGSFKRAIKNSFTKSGGQDPRWRLYAYPVSWDRPEMATHWTDPTAVKFASFTEWLNYVHPFNGPSLKGNYKFNTYVAFFYTIATDWNPAAIPRNLKQVPRHPWIGIYRAAFHDARPHQVLDLLIWDLDARRRCPGTGPPLFKDLLFMQRSWIDFVQRRGSEKNPGTRIGRVWLGGFDINPEIVSPSAIDTTLRFIPFMLKDLKAELPLPARVLCKRGFREVQLYDVPPSHPVSRPADDESVAMDIDRPSEDELDDEDDDDTRIIFHPPRGTKMVPGQRTKCANKLYEDARLARARRSGDDTMTFQFTPTTQWYEDQVNEGRGFQFINVEPWDDINRDLQVDKLEEELRKLQGVPEVPGTGGTSRRFAEPSVYASTW